MAWASTDQWNNDIARTIYKQGDQLAEKLFSAGKITAAEQPIIAAKFVLKRFTSLGFPIPQKVALQLGLDTSQAATGVSTQLAKAASPAVTAATRGGALQASKNVLRGGWPIAVGLFLLETCHTGYKLARGSINRGEAVKRTAESAGSGVGGLAGAAAGAAVGTAIFPGVGTAIGCAIGGFGGGIAVRKVVRHVARQRIAAE